MLGVADCGAFLAVGILQKSTCFTQSEVSFTVFKQQFSALFKTLEQTDSSCRTTGLTDSAPALRTSPPVSSHGLCHATPSERMLNNSARTALCTDSPTSSQFLTSGAELRSVERSGSRRESKAHVSRISCVSCSVTSVLWCRSLGSCQDPEARAWLENKLIKT